VNETAALWAGPFGDSYTERNRVEWRKRIPFWNDIIDLTGVRSVYEVGCNAGFNLSAIRRAFPDVALAGHDINKRAASQAGYANLQVIHEPNMTWMNNAYELVFTSGVLIHVAPNDLPAFMKAIVHASADYVLAIEYAADKEEEIPYRGQHRALWKRPYGKLYEQMGLTLVLQGDAGAGFDRCQFWLLRK
jgi:spore coat polysaccharide biosynthesis protein SpsF